MPANNLPVYPLTPNLGIKTLTTGDTTKDGTTLSGLWTAGSSGSYLFKVVAIPMGSNTASVLRVWLNNGSSIGSAANNAMVKDVSLPATTNSEIAGLDEVVVPLEVAVPNGWKVLCAIGTTVSAGWALTIIGADF